jgi:lysine-N-methylase
MKMALGSRESFLKGTYMKLIAPNYYETFTCIAGRCKHSCCIGWEIDIDEDTLRDYQSVEGAFGERLREGIEIKEDCACFRLGEDERCPFLNENGLCDIILNLGEDRLSQICTDHPRFCAFWSDRTEIGLGLCCEEAARIILSQKKKTKLIALQDDGEYGDLTEEEESLLCERERMFAIAQNRSMSISARIRSLCETFRVDIPQRSFSEWVDTFLSLEIMDGAWEALLREARGHGALWEDVAFESAWEQLLIYFIYRHVSDPERDVRKILFFSVLGVSFIRELFAYVCKRDGKSDFDSLVELCRLYSSEIEYSVENTEKIMELV